MDLFKFNSIEIRDLAVSTFAIALIFAWNGGSIIPIINMNFIITFIVILIAVGTGFVLHELAHRTVARHFGAISEFRAWYNGLAIALVLKILIGTTFIAPGAVYIWKDYLTSRENGLISIAGPLTNVALAIVFYMFYLMHIPIISDIGYHGYYINIFLAGFNMIPIPPFDGSKILSWNPKIYLLTTIPLAYLIFFH
ncbi:site-2 protease family protein [Methanococcus aeolicus]|nr:site-2 protease family protein [Methanococcus aeolicus]UXM85573.1 site-2 protease family protein [Methanococcus aeolicus]